MLLTNNAYVFNFRAGKFVFAAGGSTSIPAWQAGQVEVSMFVFGVCFQIYFTLILNTSDFK